MTGETASRVLFLDPSLGTGVGHHEPLARGFAALLAPRRLSFAGASRASLELPENARFEAVFEHRLTDAFRLTRYGTGFARVGSALGRAEHATRRALGAPLRGLPSGDLAKRPLEIRELKQRLKALGARSGLAALLESGRWSSVVCLAADPATLCALHDLAPFFSSPESPVLHLVFMYPETEFLAASSETAYFAMVRDLMGAVRPARLHAELDEHACDLERRLGGVVGRQTLPYRLPLDGPAPSGAFTVAVLGAGRRDKAFDLLPRIAEHTLSLDPDVEFRIQRPRGPWDLRPFVAALERLPNVTLLAPFLAERDYLAELQRAHAILIAYDPQRYARRSSAIYADAIASARPIVCVANTALARGLRGNGVAGEDAPGFAEAITQVRASYAEMRVAAVAARDDAVEAIRSGSLMRAIEEESAS